MGPDGERHDIFRRIVRAIAPDVVCLQEVIGPGTDEKLTTMMNRWLPMEGRSWHVHHASDNVILSRYPLRHRTEELPVPFPLPHVGLPDYRYGQAMCLVDLPGKNQADLYLVAMHNKSRGGEENVQMRQRQSDSIVRHLREVRTASWFRDRTPIVILGDMNVLAVEPADPTFHLTTLLTGNILNEDEFGADTPIDYDRSNLIEVKPRHNGREKEFYTWRQDDSPFPPGALDRIIYSDSVLKATHSFILNTTTMAESELSASGLLKSDVLWRSESGHFDHLPMVVDFVERE